MMFENSDTLRIVAVLARLLPLAGEYVNVSRVDLRMVDHAPVIVVHQSPFDWRGQITQTQEAAQDRDQLMHALVVELDAVHTAERDTFMIGGVRVEVKA